MFWVFFSLPVHPLLAELWHCFKNQKNIRGKMALHIFKETLRGKKICYMESICYMTIIYNMIVARFLRNVPSLKRKKQKTDGNEGENSWVTQEETREVCRAFRAVKDSGLKMIGKHFNSQKQRSDIILDRRLHTGYCLNDGTRQPFLKPRKT